ncbi:MAG: hypothetical protein ACYDG7_04375, partial [Thermoleophilia bacterium]
FSVSVFATAAITLSLNRSGVPCSTRRGSSGNHSGHFISPAAQVKYAGLNLGAFEAVTPAGIIIPRAFETRQENTAGGVAGGSLPHHISRRKIAGR